MKSQKRNTPLKKKQKYEAESPLSTPQKADSSVKLVRFHDAEIEIIEDIKQPQKTSKKPDLEKICEDDDDEETLEAFSVIRNFDLKKIRIIISFLLNCSDITMLRKL